jgi:uncharacterized protein (DUF1800 family)
VSTSRRGLLTAGAAVTASVASAPLAWGGTSYPTRPYRATPVPRPLERHYLNRLGCGFSPVAHQQLLRDGSPRAWFEAQLVPSRIPESAAAQALPSWFPDLAASPSAKWAQQTAGVTSSWQHAMELSAYSVLRQVYSTRQLLETMVAFWSNHLHVQSGHRTAWAHRHSYDQTVRRHALGTFEDLLLACTLHPAMLLYLDGSTSVRNAPNENHGRELLELHTVGRGSGYTEAMVKSSAVILSGWTVDDPASPSATYSPARHTTGAVHVLGFSAANTAPDGQAMTRDYLRFLAHHPATAANIARRLCRYFVGDHPSEAMVSAVAKAFRDSGTDIPTTLRALVTHPGFAASAGALVRDPVQDFVATCRVLQVRARRPTGDASFARACVWSLSTTPPYNWPRPDGAPLGNAAWSSASRMLSSFRMHWNLAAGWYPTQDVTYRASGASWLPTGRIRFDRWVDHLCRVLLGRRSDSRMLTAAVTVTGYPPRTVVTRDHPLASWLFVRVVGALLDSPDHMHR